MSDLPPPSALDFLPANIARKPLYDFLGPLIDYVLQPSTDSLIEPVDELVAPLLLDYQDAEAVNAYLNLLVHPIIGTRRSLDYALRLLNISPALTEWFEPAVQSPYDVVPPTGVSDRPYHFSVTFPNDGLPKGPFSYRDLIRMLLALKNERSRLMSIRMADCVGELTLDNDCITDMYYLDSLEGFTDPETGVNICLHEHFSQMVDETPHVVGAERTTYSEQVTRAFTLGLLDFTILGEDTYLDLSTILIGNSRTSSRAANFAYPMGNFNLATGLMIKAGGRTSQRAQSAGGANIATRQSVSRTSATSQRAILGLSPVPRQTIPIRLMSQQVPPESFYQQRAWQDYASQTGHSTVTFVLSGDAALNVDAIVELRINGVLVDSVSIRAVNSLGQTQAFTYTGDFGVGPLPVTVTFTNDYYDQPSHQDRNAYLISLEVNGVLNVVNAPLMSTGDHYTGTPLFGAQPRSWLDHQLTWQSRQPQAYGGHVSQIVSGWTLGPVNATLGRPAGGSTVVFGTLGVGRLREALPTVAAFGMAPPAGQVVAVFGRPAILSGGAIGVGVKGLGTLVRPTLSAGALQVPVGNGLLSLAAPAGGGLGSVFQGVFGLGNLRGAQPTIQGAGVVSITATGVTRLLARPRILSFGREGTYGRAGASFGRPRLNATGIKG